MIRFDEIPEVYIVKGVTDLRKGIDGYTSIIQELYQTVLSRMFCLFFVTDIEIRSNVFTGMEMVSGCCIKDLKKVIFNFLYGKTE